MSAGKISLQGVQDEPDINTHVGSGDALQSSDSRSGKLLRCGFIVHDAFEICGGQLDQGLEEISLFRVTSRDMPQPFKDLV